MVRKLIAAIAVLVVTAWAAMYPAPMLAVHALHTHSALVAFEAAHHHATPASHPCCPGLKAAPIAVPVEFAAGSEPCAEQHRCCIGQGPQSAPAPARESHQPSPDLHVIQVLAASAAPPSPLAHASVIERDLSPPAIFGMVLRI